MKTRKEVIDWWNAIYIVPTKKNGWHIGLCEVRDLLDFIYSGPPASINEHFNIQPVLKQVKRKRDAEEIQSRSDRT